jgi:ribulose-phosphate 3-epimerase
MAMPVDPFIEAFSKAGAKRISIHPDATIHLDRSLHLIRESGCEAGLALNPATSPELLAWCVHKLDFVLVMTVNPGFGGQSLIPETLSKITNIHRQYPQLTICVDGGVTCDNIASLAAAGATQFVAGSAIFNTADYSKTIADLREKLWTLDRTA